MEKTKTAISEIKELLVKFGFLKKEEETSDEKSDEKTDETYETFLDVVLVDGTKLMVEGETLVEGAKVSVVTDDAEVPAPDGEYELEDGTKITIKDGLVETIVAVEETPAEEDEKLAEDEKPAEDETPADETVTEDVAELVSMMKTVIEKLGEFTTSMESKFENVETQIKEIEDNVEKFGKTPAGDPINYEKTDETAQKINPLDARVSAIVGMKNKKK